MKKWRRSLWIKMLVCVLVANVCCVSNISGVVKKANADTTTESGSGDTHGFIKVNGDKMYDENGKEYRIKSMGMGNNVWGTTSLGKNATILDTYVTEDGYKELSELGFNAVRFYINYYFFISNDSDPNNIVWKESAFEWLSKNIAWAKKYDMKVLINMHVPTGGFMKENQPDFWGPINEAKELNTNNMLLTKKLWTEIARRYSDETAVLGYGLLNEPFLYASYRNVYKEYKEQPEEEAIVNYLYSKTPGQLLDQYYGYLEELKTSIREVDNNHMLFIERPYGYVNYKKTFLLQSNNTYDSGTETKSTSYWGYTESFRLLNDNNTVYEFHYYEPDTLTSNGLSYKPEEPDYTYSDTIAIKNGSADASVEFLDEVKNVNVAIDNWQNVESNFYKATANDNYGYWKVRVTDPGKNGFVGFDNIVISEYDENGNYVRDVNKYSFSNYKASFTAKGNVEIQKDDKGNTRTPAFYYYNTNTKESSMAVGYYNSSGSLTITKNGLIQFPMKSGYSYKISADVKFLYCDSTVKVDIGFQTIKCKGVRLLTKDYLADFMDTWLNWGKEKGVPMYLGEVGSSNYSILNTNADTYLRDIFDIMNEKNVNYSYHDYHDANWGFYRDAMNEYCTEANRNPKTYEVFKEKVNYESEPEITELPAPVVKATSNKNKKVTLTWDAVPGATSYQLYKYYASSGTIQKSTVVTGTTYTFNGLKKGSTYRYIVQAIGDNALSNNVDGKFAVDARVGVNNDAVIADAAYDADANSLTLSWDKVSGVSEYYVYKYYASTKQLSAPKTTTKNACKYYSVKNGKVNRYLVTTKKIDDLTNYDGRGCISVYVP
ncbi:Fibronectin type III domain-containing protein [Lachnospiraceae bacterium RM5]|nr:Fibronectin type III domain-containing protein [Lachnospiraceae bacterium RM5]